MTQMDNALRDWDSIAKQYANEINQVESGLGLMLKRAGDEVSKAALCMHLAKRLREVADRLVDVGEQAIGDELRPVLEREE